VGGVVLWGCGGVGRIGVWAALVLQDLDCGLRGVFMAVESFGFELPDTWRCGPRPGVKFASVRLTGPGFCLGRLVAAGPAPGWALFFLSSGTSIKAHTFYLKNLDLITKKTSQR
jgi:hypothetical protein